MNLIIKSVKLCAVVLLVVTVFHSAVLAATISIIVDGVEDDMLKNVLTFLSIEQEKDHPDLSERQIQLLHERAIDEIKLALQPFGYYHPTIQSELTHDDSGWVARYHIELGEAVMISDVDLQVKGAGLDDPEFKRLIETFPVKQNDILEHARYENAKGQFQKLAEERGYFDMTLTMHEIQIDRVKNTARIVLHMDTGLRYHFGSVTFKQDVLTPKLLNRLVPFKRGEPYSITHLLKLQNNLIDSDYFKQVEVVPHVDLSERLEVPLEVSLVPHKPQRYSIGIGFGTDTGIRGGIGMELRRLNRHGHRLKSELKISEIRKGLTAQYIMPIKNPLTNRLSFTTSYLEEDTDTSDSETILFGINYALLRFGWDTTFSLQFQREEFVISDQSDTSTLIMPEASFLRIRADDRVYTTHGSRIGLNIRGATETLGSDTSFLQTRLEGKLIRGLGEKGRVIMRGDLGLSLVSEFTELPASIRFFAGGDNSVRGYDFKELGPVDDLGNVIGGKHLVIGSIEYEYKVKGNWSAAVFYDIGNALDSFAESLKQGAGVGIRWRLPVGLVRLDLASALSEPGNPLRLHVTIGVDL